jgi:hypothetical protein
MQKLNCCKNLVFKQVSISKCVLKSNTISTFSRLEAGKLWRQSVGLSKLQTSRGPLIDLPDYSFVGNSKKKFFFSCISSKYSYLYTIERSMCCNLILYLFSNLKAFENLIIILPTSFITKLCLCFIFKDGRPVPLAEGQLKRKELQEKLTV